MNEINLGVISPVYNEEKNLILFLGEVIDVLTPTCFYLIDDGSQDQSVSVAVEYLNQNNQEFHLIELSRNFGKEPALMQLIKKIDVTMDYYVILDSDGQHSPQFAKDMLDQLVQDSHVDLVCAVKNRVTEGLFKRFLSKIFYWLVNDNKRFHIKPNVGDFHVMRHYVVRALQQLSESNLFNKGLYAWLGFQPKYVSYVPQRRVHGKSHWSFFSLLDLAVDGITSFSLRPIKLIFAGGVFMSILAVIFILYTALNYFLYDVAPGYSTLVSLVSLFGGLTLTSISVLGIYIGKIYMETKKRPLCVIKKEHRSSLF